MHLILILEISWDIFHRCVLKHTLLTPSMAKKRMAAREREIELVFMLEGMSWAALCTTATPCGRQINIVNTSTKQSKGVDWAISGTLLVRQLLPSQPHLIFSPLIANSAFFSLIMPDAGGAMAALEALTIAIPRWAGRTALKADNCCLALVDLPRQAAFCWARDMCIAATIFVGKLAIN
jgi:hypothetical protein